MPVSAEVATLFLDELARRKVEVQPTDDGRYAIELPGGLSAKVSLENLSRDFERDRDPERVVDFVNTILTSLETPAWADVEPYIRWQIEPSDSEFSEAVREPISDKATLVLVHVDPSETQISWIMPSDAEHWGKTIDELKATAQANMNRILLDTKIEVKEVEPHRLGVLSNELVAFKAALLLCSDLRRVVEPVIGWPLLAVMPCRDFVYILNQQDEELLGRMGHVVVKEYQQSGYPISTEVFAIDDDSVRAIGDYQPDNAAPDPNEDVADDDGMKTIAYRGGIVTFRIPAHWCEEYEEEGGGTFFDEDSEGTLRLSVITLASKTPVTARDALRVLEDSRDDDEGELIELRPGDALLRYVSPAEEDGEELLIYNWQVANVVPPNHVRIAIFSYTVTKAMADDEDIAADIEIIDEELRKCRFAQQLGE